MRYIFLSRQALEDEAIVDVVVGYRAVLYRLSNGHGLGADIPVLPGLFRGDGTVPSVLHDSEAFKRQAAAHRDDRMFTFAIATCPGRCRGAEVVRRYLDQLGYTEVQTKKGRWVCGGCGEAGTGRPTDLDKLEAVLKGATP